MSKHRSTADDVAHTRAAAVILMVVSIWMIYCGWVALQPSPQEVPQPLPLCIDAPEFTCIIPAQDATDIELGA